MPLYRTEPSASALAHGPAKTDDIERARRVLDDAKGHVTRDRLTAARRELTRRIAPGAPPVDDAELTSCPDATTT